MTSQTIRQIIDAFIAVFFFKITAVVAICAGKTRPTARMTRAAIAIGIAVIHRERMVERCIVEIARILMAIPARA